MGRGIGMEAGDLLSVFRLALALTLALLKALMKGALLVLGLEPLRDCWTRFTAVFQILRSFATKRKILLSSISHSLVWAPYRLGVCLCFIGVSVNSNEITFHSDCI